MLSCLGIRSTNIRRENYLDFVGGSFPCSVFYFLILSQESQGPVSHRLWREDYPLKTYFNTYVHASLRKISSRSRFATIAKIDERRFTYGNDPCHRKRER